MALSSQNIDSMKVMFDQLTESVAIKTAEKLRPALEQQYAGQLENLGLDPMKVYSPQEVADLLGTNRIESIYAIQESELPRVKRIGTRIGYLGINLLCYMHNLPPVDMPAVIENYRDRLLQAAPKVQPIHPNKPGMTKVL